MNDQVAPDAATSVPAAPTATARKVLFSAMKNEAPFLLEWVAYHRVIGFDEIVICSNPSNDGTEELLAALAKAGAIRHLRATVPEGASPQFVATQLFEKKVRFREGDWYMWLDADEFLNVHVGDRTVGALVDAIGDKRIALINWRIFGSNGHAAFPGRFIDEAFDHASKDSFDRNFVVKSIFRHSAAIRGFARHGIHRPLIAKGSDLQFEDIVVGSGATAHPEGRAHRRWLNGRDIVHTSRVYRDEAGWSLAQVNHYIVRTRDFFELKRLRGRGYMPRAKTTENNRHNSDFFAQHDRNEVEDRSILHWKDAVSAEIARLLAIAPVKKASVAAQERVSQALAQLDQRTTAAAVAIAEPKPWEFSGTIDQDVDRADVPMVLSLDQSFGPKERALLTKTYAGAGTILEYGAGASTVHAALAGQRIVSVESDAAWGQLMAEYLNSISEKAEIHSVDIGPTGAWGMPRKARHCALFPRYPLSVWDLPDLGDPDVVMIDGRFRKACLLAVRLRARRPTTVLFDDYVGRTHYHGVERLAQKEEVAGRMARFTVTPGAVPPEMLTQVMSWFNDPR